MRVNGTETGSMPLPNFIIIGAAKAGTTALYFYLDQHPEVFMSPVKETQYFVRSAKDIPHRVPYDAEKAKNWIDTEEKYLALFEGVTGEKAIGEASPGYMSLPWVAERIDRAIPGVKLVAILRDPVKRAFSHYLMLVRNGREKRRDFAKVVMDEEAAWKRGDEPFPQYVKRGFYHDELLPFWERFGPERLHICFNEDLAKNGVPLMQEIYRYIGVDPAFVPDVSPVNTGEMPKNEVVNDFLTKPNAMKSALKFVVPSGLRKSVASNLKERNSFRPEMPPGLREHLIEGYRTDILKLQDLLKRDLSAWLK